MKDFNVATASIPILLLSACADERLCVQLLRVCANDYVTKPFSTEELQARAQNLIEIKRTRDVLKTSLSKNSNDLVAMAQELA